MSIAVELPDALVDALAQRVAGLVEGTSARQWFNAEQAADYLGTTQDAVKAMVKRGQLEPTRRRPHYLFARETLDAWARGPV
jgi:excisionase family DNA binding protein